MAKGKCSKCLVDLTLTNSYKRVYTKGNGYCFTCNHIWKRENYRKNVDKKRAQARACYERNREDRILYSARYREDNPDKITESNRRQYYKDIQKSRARVSTYSKTEKGRHTHVRKVLKEDSIDLTDPLWNFNYYMEFIRDAVCHYCLGPLSPASHALDRMNSDLGHCCFNVVPCCWECNRIKGKYWEYGHMMLLAPKLRKIRQEKQSAVNA